MTGEERPHCCAVPGCEGCDYYCRREALFVERVEEWQRRWEHLWYWVVANGPINAEEDEDG